MRMQKITLSIWLGDDAQAAGDSYIGILPGDRIGLTGCRQNTVKEDLAEKQNLITASEC